MLDIRDKIIEGKRSGSFLDTVYRLCLSDRDERSMVSQELISLHNDKVVNVVSEFLELRNSAKGHDFFLTRHVFEELLSDIDAPVENVMQCVKHLTLEAGNDLAAGTIIAPFIEFLKANQDRPGQALRLAVNAADGSFDFITPAVIAGSAIDFEQFAKKAIELTCHSDRYISICAVFAIGRLNYADHPELIHESIKVFNSVLDQDFDEMLFSSALRAIYSLYKQNNNIENEVENLFRKILRHSDDHILHVASEILSADGDHLPSHITKIILKALIDIKPENGRTIENLDYGLEKLLQTDESEVIVSFLERFLYEKDGVPIAQLDGLCHAILNNQQLLNKLLTRWLLSKSVRLGRCASDLLAIGSDRGLELSVDGEQLEAKEAGIHAFLARKACGWFFMCQISAASYLVSLIEFAPENELDIISGILFNPLLISYPGSVKEFLEKKQSSVADRTSLVIRQVLANLEGYHNGLDAAKNIKELWPSLAQREAYNRHHSRLMSQSYDEAQKDAIWTKIATMSVLLYGRKSIHYVQHGVNGDSSRQEIPLKNFSYSVEFPSVDLLDHTGLEYQLRIFRTEGCIS